MREALAKVWGMEEVEILLQTINFQRKKKKKR